jgi:hypothetical protein
MTRGIGLHEERNTAGTVDFISQLRQLVPTLFNGILRRGIGSKNVTKSAVNKKADHHDDRNENAELIRGH